MHRTMTKNLPKHKGIPEVVCTTAVFKAICHKGIFIDLDDHMKDCTVGGKHVYLLVKSIVKMYCKIGLHHLGKEKTSEINSRNIRKTFSKLILFNHQ